MPASVTAQASDSPAGTQSGAATGQARDHGEVEQDRGRRAGAKRSSALSTPP